MPLELNAPSAACGMQFVALWLRFLCVHTPHTSQPPPLPLPSNTNWHKIHLWPFFSCCPSVFRLVRLKESTNGRTNGRTNESTSRNSRRSSKGIARNGRRDSNRHSNLICIACTVLGQFESRAGAAFIWFWFHILGPQHSRQAQWQQQRQSNSSGNNNKNSYHNLLCPALLCGTVFGSPTSSTTITIAQHSLPGFPFAIACAWPRHMPLAPRLALRCLASPLGQRLKLTSLTSCLSSLFHPQAALFLPASTPSPCPAHFHCHANARSRAHTHFHFILSSLCWTGANALSAST